MLVCQRMLLCVFIECVSLLSLEVVFEDAECWAGAVFWGGSSMCCKKSTPGEWGQSPPLGRGGISFGLITFLNRN